MRIILFCPPAVVITGGIKYIFLLAQALRTQGFDAVVFEEQGRKPAWLDTSVPVVGQGVFQPRADEILVLPEDQPQILRLFKDWPQKKVLYAQNQFYEAQSLPNGESFADFGITHALCSSQSILEHMKWRHPGVVPFLLPYGIDQTLFKPGEKTKTILYVPRKRPVEAAFIRDLFRYAHPAYADWIWQAVEGKSETETARMMGEASVFLSLSRLESFGLTPIEAMAAGCVVAGFMGLGGREYARPENGFWAEEDDFPACVAQVAKAVALAALPSDDPARRTYEAAAKATIDRYTPEVFAAAAKAAFDVMVNA